MPDKASQYEYPFQDPDLPIDERIDNLLSLMTIDEKVACLSTDPSVPRLGVRGTGHIEGLHGVAMGVPGHWGRKEPVSTTTFPQAIGLGQTWDPELITRVAGVEGYEARYLWQSERYGRGGLVVRAPNADIGRDPRWGRTEECYGEDAFFNGVLTAAFVRGLQGDHPRYWQTAALMKHFLANSNEDGREGSSSDFDERLFREYYSLPFRMGIEAGSRAFMAAYNAYNGIAAAVHPMLKQIAVEEWGQDGIICTDGGAMKMLVTDHKAFADFEEASAAVVKAGIGQFLDDYVDAIRGALARGLVTEADIDAALIGNFRVMICLGLLDPPEQVPYAAIGKDGESEPWLDESRPEFVREVTRKSIVLLKNDAGLLPLSRAGLSSVAVIGPMADVVHFDWYSGSAPYTVTPLEALRTALEPNTAVRYEDGVDIEAAVEAARTADVAIVFVGNNPNADGAWKVVHASDEGREAVDRKSIDLRPEHEDLLRRVHAVNPNTVLVLVSSFPYAIVWAQENLPAIVQMTHNSQEQGTAIADVLLGDYNPAGRTVQTWPRSIDDLPPMMDYDIRHGRTYQYFEGEPLYPFGYGLSYTSFRHDNLKISTAGAGAERAFTVDVDVTNTGIRAGDEVVQVYVRFLNSPVARPKQILVGFQRVEIEPGQTRTVTVDVERTQLAYWDETAHRFVLPAERVEVLVGRSSTDFVQEARIDVAGD